jgi:phage terminase large subunit-like protein
MKKTLKYTDPGTQYCRDVLSGKILACRKIKQACQRHLTDLKRIGDSDFPYVYHQNLAYGAINFARMIPDVNTKKLIEPLPFQKWIIAMIFGWRRIDRSARWNNALISMARANSKSQIASWLCSYDFFFSKPRYNKQILIGASSNDQASHLLAYVESNIESLMSSERQFHNEKAQKLQAFFHSLKNEIVLNDNCIKWDKYYTSVRKVSQDTKGLDTWHPTLACLDETHSVTRDDFVSKISSGMINNDESLLLQTSTAGLDPKVPLFHEYELASKILDGKIKMDDYFIAIYEQDDKKEAYESETWEKSNPLIAEPEQRKQFLKKIPAEREKQIMEGNFEKFLVKNMNLWQNASRNSYINIDTWKSNIIDQFNFNKRKVYIGYDASMTSDDTSFGFDFPYIDENGQHKFFIFQHSFIPTQKAGSIEAKEKIDGIPYRKYEDQGYCEITRNQFGLISDDQVYNWLLNFVKQHQLQVLAFCYDSYHADKIVNALQNNTDWNIVPVRQGTISLNAPTKDLRDRLIEHSVTHFDDKIMEAGFSNAILKIDNNGIKVDKDTGSQKIDCVDAVMDAHFQAMYHFENYDENDPNNMSIDDLNKYFQSDDFGF